MTEWVLGTPEGTWLLTAVPFLIAYAAWLIYDNLIGY